MRAQIAHIPTVAGMTRITHIAGSRSCAAVMEASDGHRLGPATGQAMAGVQHGDLCSHVTPTMQREAAVMIDQLLRQ
jgi:hypothetical protein